MDLLVVELTKHQRVGWDNAKVFEQFRVVHNGEQPFQIQQTDYCCQLTQPGKQKINLFGHIKVQTHYGAVIQEFKPKYHNHVAVDSINLEASKSVTFYSKGGIIFLELINALDQKYIYIVKSNFRTMAVEGCKRRRSSTVLSWETADWQIIEDEPRQMFDWYSASGGRSLPQVYIGETYNFDTDRYDFVEGKRYPLMSAAGSDEVTITRIFGEFYMFFD